MLCPVLLHMLCLGRVLCVLNVMSCVITHVVFRTLNVMSRVITHVVFRTCHVCTECYVLCHYTYCV